MSFADILIIALVLGLVVLALVWQRRRKKAGKGCCGCEGCSASASCSASQQGQK